MKFPFLHATRTTQHATRLAHRESGSTVIVIIALLAILLLYMAYNLRTIANLGRELRLLERQQIRRLQGPAPRTNAPPAVIINTNAIPPTRTN
jgi:hypothetical protein